MKFWLKLFSLFSAVAAASTAMAQSVSITAPVAGAKVAFNAATTITADAAPGTGTGVTVTQVQFFANGIPIGAPDTTAPFSVAWTPGAVGTYSLTAVVTDSASSTKTSAAVSVEAVDLGLPPTVVISSPPSGSELIVGFATTISATASDPDGNVASVQFIANGAVVGTVTTFPFNFSWTPASPGIYALTAKATDNAGNITTSAPVNVTVGAGSSPTVALTSPLANTTVNAGLAVVLAANAGDVDGTVASVKFVANNIVVGTSTTSPYRVSWTPPASGTYVIFALATDSSNNVTQSSTVTLTVSTNHSPTVSITAPTAGTGVQVGSATKITATAADQDGPISQVQFFANGISVGSVSSSPYTVSWTPTNEGLYHLTAIATDTAGSSTNSTDVGVLAFATTAAKTTTVYTGFYGFGLETGTFSLVTLGGTTATFIAQADKDKGTSNYVYVDLPLDAGGGFTQTVDGVTISGTATGGGVTGTITGLPGTLPFLLFTGSAVGATDTSFAGRGYYTGSLDGRAGSLFYAIVGGDGSVKLYAKDGSFSDVAGGKIPTTGNLSGLRLTGGGGITGKIDTATGFISGSFTGASTANFSGTLTSGGLFSDGSLRNISTRGQVGSGDNVLIMGFIVGGNSPKRVLLRAIGPGLATHGIASGFIADPKFDLRTGSTLLASNDNWDPADAAIAAYGTLAAKDAALIVTLSPGAYTVTVSAATGSGGLALVECYDLDSVDAFSGQKVVNISTRGLVGTGQNVLIGGFIISGNASKRVLVRAVGPTLSSFNVNGVLADPELSLLRLQSDGTYATVRANGDWEAGNDVSQIAAATLAAGAYDLPAGSKDASMLVVLPPGTYTTVVSGSGATSGIALVEVWEVP